mgnify:CR=1 FL=1
MSKFANDPLNREFSSLLQATGWSQVAVSKKLFRTQGVVSQYIKGTTRPSRSTVQLLKRIIAEEKPEALTTENSGARSVTHSIQSRNPATQSGGTSVMKYVDNEDIGGIVVKESPVHAKIRELDQESHRAVEEFVNYLHTKKRKKKAKDHTAD